MYWHAGNILAESIPFTIPPGNPSHPENDNAPELYTYTLPFTFTGWLCGSESPYWSYPPVFLDGCTVYLPALTGSGIITVTGHYLEDGSSMTFEVTMSDARLDFTVPEPVTGMLTILVLPLVLMARWRKKPVAP